MVRRAVRPGTSLVEMEVALLILAIGLLASIPLAVRSLGLVNEASLIERANSTAAAILDSLVQLRSPGAGSRVRDVITLDWTAQPVAGSTRIELHIRWVSGRHVEADTLTTFAGRWPRRLQRVP